MNDLILNEQNYYSLESNQAYWSVSQYKDFMRCESMAMAKIRGEYEQPMTRAMLVGSFVDRYFEGTLPQFIEEHPELFTLKRQLRAEFRRAYEIINCIEKERKFMASMSGEKQKILTFEMFGVLWKMKMDSFAPKRFIVDLKVVASIDKIADYHYENQGAVYQYGAEYNGYGRLPFYLAMVEKIRLENKKTGEIKYPTHLRQIPDSELDKALLEIGENMPHFINVKMGLEEPRRCEKCAWCKMTRELKVRNYMELVEG